MGERRNEDGGCTVLPAEDALSARAIGGHEATESPDIIETRRCSGT